MPDSYIVGETVDDLMRFAIEAIREDGHDNYSTKGKSIELIGVLMELTNPRARLSRTETRGKLFSCVGELCWYLAGSNELEFISYYIPVYSKFSEDGRLFGAYGPRIFRGDERGQLLNVIDLLRSRSGSRQAVVQLFDSSDIIEAHKDVPCTCVLQFMVRNGALHMVTYMRSNDVYLGLPHDVFSFTMLQEITARALSVDVGVYKHAVGSLHLYEKDLPAIQRFVDEGWQPTNVSMPEMPRGDPWPNIGVLLKAEEDLRNRGYLDSDLIRGIDPYWKDIIGLLDIFRLWKDQKKGSLTAKGLKNKVASNYYRAFIEPKIQREDG